MEATKKTKDNVVINKQYGDAVRIAMMVNKGREDNGLDRISYAYVRSMLNGQRKITKEVAEAAEKFYKAQSLIMN